MLGSKRMLHAKVVASKSSTNKATKRATRGCSKRSRSNAKISCVQMQGGIRRNVAERVSHLMSEKRPARTRQASSAHDAMQRKLLHLLQPQRCAASLHEILRCFELYSGAAVHAVNLVVPETCYKKSLCEGRVAHMSVEAKAASSIARFAFFL
jgi:hypothetical protein